MHRVREAEVQKRVCKKRVSSEGTGERNFIAGRRGVCREEEWRGTNKKRYANNRLYDL